jgi:polysaccharide export outer membrane protein
LRKLNHLPKCLVFCTKGLVVQRVGWIFLIFSKKHLISALFGSSKLVNEILAVKPISKKGMDKGLVANTYFRYIFYLGIIISIIVLGSSCSAPKQLQYFNDLPDSAIVHLPPMESEERLIQKGDRIQISIGAKDMEAAAIFNRYGGVPTTGSNPSGSGGGALGQPNSELAGYLVDFDGFLEFPVIGRVKTEGLTSKQLKDTLTSQLRPYLREPLVIIRFMTFKFTVLGEVRTPGVYNLPMQRTTILDALGAAGDLPHSAQRIVEIYRDYNGQRIITKVDLRKKDILYNQAAFLVRHNDVIYVQPRESRLLSEETRVYSSFLAAVVGIVTLIVTLKK